MVAYQKMEYGHLLCINFISLKDIKKKKIII